MSGHRAAVASAWRLVRNDPIAFGLAWVMWVAFHTAPVLIGLAVKAVLDRLGDSSSPPWALLAVVLGLEVGRWGLFVLAAVQWHGAFVGWQTVPRVNLLGSLTTGGGPVAGRLPSSPGEAVSRFRDDTEDLAMVLDGWLDISGAVVAAVAAIVVMVAIEPVSALAAIVPVALALVVAVAFGPRLRAWRRAQREATGAVTGFIGDTFGGILAVKTGGAEDAVDRRFAELNEQRAVAARRDQVGSEMVRSMGYGTGEITVGVVLVAVAGAVSAGDVSVGDIALFTSSVVVIAGLAKWAGRLSVYHRQAEVSVGRLAELTRVDDPAAVVAPTVTHLRHGPPRLVVPTSTPETFRELEVVDLAVRHGSGDTGVIDVSFRIGVGEIVAVTGPVGSGKTSLVRGLLGLVPATGTVRWNGQVVEPAIDLVPPRVAYLPQVPRLFSETLRETILLGVDDSELDRALWMACLDTDLEAMEDGAVTRVGPRGVRLSGGQVQRAGAARAFARRPQLLVVDDLSSALDVATEAEMWARLRRERPPAALVVTHRPSILALADRVITLDHGCVVN